MLKGRNYLSFLLFFSLLMVGIGPRIAPQLLGNFLTAANEGVPCIWLKNPDDLRNKQSLLARASNEPLDIQVSSEPFPSEDETSWIVKIVVINLSAGTMPILFHPDQVLLSDDPATSGFGLIFRPQLPLQNFTSRNTQTTYSTDEIRLLGPRQRCHFTLEFPGAASIIDTNTFPSVAAQAYYRILSPGEHPERNDDSNPEIFIDQGLHATKGTLQVIYSQQVEIDLAPSD